MKTLFCPECKYPLASCMKGETLSEWKECPKCHVPSYMIINPEGRSSIMSLAEIIRDLKAHKYAIEALAYILKNEGAWLDDLQFNVGKPVDSDLQLLVDLRVLHTDRGGKYYTITQGMKKAVAMELHKTIKNQQWLNEMVW